jgi:hypothetical protein
MWCVQGKEEKRKKKKEKNESSDDAPAPPHALMTGKRSIGSMLNKSVLLYMRGSVVSTKFARS